MIALFATLLAVVTAPYAPVSYACDGSTAAFTINFPYQSSSNLVVTSTTAGGIATTLALTNDFTVNVVSTQSTATLALLNPSTSCPAGNTLKISRSTTLTQPTGFRQQTVFSPSLHETALDRLEMQTQEAVVSIANPVLPSVLTNSTPVLSRGGSTTLQLQDWFGVTANVKAFGAVGDGITDDSAAVQAAVNSLPTAGGEVYYPDGTYLQNTTVASTKAGVSIRGPGGGGWNAGSAATIKTTAAIIVFDFGSASSTEHKGVQVRGISVNDASNGGLGGLALGAFRIRRQNHVRFDDVSINQFGGGYGVTFDGTGDAIILPQLIGVRARATKFGIVQIGTVTAMWCSPTSYFTGPSPNTGSIGITLTGDTSIINCAVDAHETGIKISGDEHRIFGARLENNALHVWIAGPTARRNTIIGNSFSSGGTTATVQIDNGATIFSNLVSGNQYSAPAVGIVDNSPIGSSSYIYEPQQNLMRNRQTVTGTYQFEMNNMRQAGAGTDIGGFLATSNGISMALQSLGNGFGLVGTTNAFNVNLVRNNVTIAQLLASDFLVTNGIAPDGGGMKHKRGTAGCVTAAASGAVCTTTISWTTAFADSNYTATCNGTLITSGVPVNGGFTAKAAASVTFQTVAMTAVAAQFTSVDCIAIHD